MYNEADDRPATARTSDLVEELGQVEFVFSDKTGTLTQNVMKFKKCSINGVIYGNEVGIGKASGQDSRISDILANRHLGDADKTAIAKFLIHMSLCHTVFPTESREKSRIPAYQASSPDELALVEGAAMLGFVFQDKTMNTLFTRTAGSNEKLAWEILAEIPFNSNRKRMSLILKEPISNRIILLCKGADQVMFPLLREDQALRHIVEDHLHHFAIEGLRTLVMCQKELEEIDFKRWHKQWKELQLSNSVDKDAQLDKLGATIENKLELLGASAIEDKLQDGVPDTIALLIAAGIRVWVLTGDKQETAVEIGKSCNLIKSNMRLLDFSSTTQAELLSKIDTYTSELVSSTQGAVGKTLYQLARIKESLKQKIAIVIDGVSLLWAIENSLETRQLFFKLGYLSNSCICCRVSPAQKMQIVQLAKENGTWITLAVGDGANDVSMIQEAHIGVGIAGKEGTQAVQSADYSISQFRYLQRLLLVHGRWGYRRISWFICYYFYKNIAVVFTELCFAFMNGLSGQIYFLDWLPMLYNALWTSWPCMFTFIFEQDLRDTEALAHPSTYQAGQRRLYFTFKTFWTWVATSMWHGLVCFWVPFQGLGFAVNGKGWDTGLWWVSTVSFTMVIHVITVKLFVESIYWNKVNT
jgi:phospholipid-translocating P-type ATPase (flippase)